MQAAAPPHTAWPLEGPGVWIEIRTPPAAAPGPALFLDRDGVIVEDRGYICEEGNVVLMPGAAALIAAANAAGVPVAVATNQSGIGRGLFGWPAFAAVQRRIDALLAAQGARIDAVAACPFHPDHTQAYGADHAAWRKPGPRMIAALGERLNAGPALSWMVGDAARDIEAARSAGLAGAILVPGDGASAAPDGGFDLRPAADLAEALGILRDRLFGTGPAGRPA